MSEAGLTASEPASAAAVVRPPARAAQWIYALSLAASVSLWFLAIRAPLWLDETGSYWQISGGFSQLWARQSLSFVAYPGILWFWTRLFGVSEVALRIPSVLAMLAALGFLFLAARELFDPDIALIATVIFSLNPLVQIEAADARPYAFAALAINLSIWIVLRLRRSGSLPMAAAFGFSAALILWFQYLFAVLLPALVVCFFLPSPVPRRRRIQQFAAACAVFAIAILPLLPGLRYLFHTSGTHVFDTPPTVDDLIFTLAPGWLPAILAVTAILAAIAGRRKRSPGPIALPRATVAACASLALIPALTLFLLSVATPLHLFVERHRMVAVPGIALAWALLLSPFCFRWIRIFFCVALVAVAGTQYCVAPLRNQLQYSWKYALQVAQSAASRDDAPILMCSDFPESDYAAMPLGHAKDSRYFSQLSYYRLTPPVVPLPRSLNAQAMRIASQFLADASQKHTRFLFLAYYPSWPTLDWLARQAAPAFTARPLGIYSGVKVVEFDPRPHAGR